MYCKAKRKGLSVKTMVLTLIVLLGSVLIAPPRVEAAEFTLMPGQTKTVRTTSPYQEDGIHQVTASYYWSSSDPGVCSASGSGLSCTVTAMRAGTAKITCTCTYTLYLYSAITRRWEVQDSGTLFFYWNFEVTEPCTITFDPNGGYLSTTYRTASKGLPYETLPTPTKTGYSFDGWYTSASGGTKITASSIVPGDITLYAHWSLGRYTITFNANGGGVIPSSRTITYGEAIGDLPTPTRTGYTFDGWYSQSSGGTTITGTEKPSSSYSIYAHWTPIPCAISLDANGGSVSSRVVTRDYDGAYGELPVPTRTDHMFIGWFTAATDGTQIAERDTVSGDVTLYAHWLVLTGSCGSNLTWRLTLDGQLTISGTGGMAAVGSSSGAPWYYLRDKITSLKIDNQVTSISGNAFYDYDALTSVSLPGSLTSIGDSAFSDCDNLKNVSFSAGLMSIGTSAFADCDSLTSISLPADLTSIGVSAFENCDSLTSVSLPSSLTSIGDSAFYDCDGLTSFSLPAGLTSIGERAFENCDSLTSVRLPAGLTSFGTYAFADCDSLTSVSLPAGLTSIGRAAFYDCDGLTSISLPAGLTSIGTYAFADCDSLTSISLPADLTSIGERAFDNCDSLTSVSLPSGLMSVDDNAFRDCKNLTKVVILGDQTIVGSYAFADCNQLTELSLPNDSSNIKDTAFQGCYGLADEDGMVILNGVLIDYTKKDEGSMNRTFTVPAGVTRIGDYALSEFWRMSEVVIPNTVTSIGYGAFELCMNLSAITLPDVVSIGGGAFKYCNKLADENGFIIVRRVLYDYIGSETELAIPDGVIRISDAAFFTKSVVSVTIPDGVTSIGGGAFWCCSDLERIVIPASVVSFEDLAFNSCSSLKDIYFGGSITQWNAIEQGSAVFYYSNISNATIHYGVNEYVPVESVSIRLPPARLKPGESRNLTVLVKPDFATDKDVTWTTDNPRVATVDSNGTVTAVNSGTVQITATAGGVSGICTISVDKRYAVTGGDVFFDPLSGTITGSETSVTSADIPEVIGGVTVKAIGANAFESCVRLERVTIPPSVTSIGSNAFHWCYELRSVVIPDGVTSIADSAFSWCKGMTTVFIPASVKTIGKFAFNQCAALLLVYYPGSEADWASISIGEYNDALKNAEKIYRYTPETFVEATDISLNKTSLTLNVGESAELSATILPANATIKTVVWSAGSSSYVKVDGNGVVTALKYGTETITVATVNGLTATCTVRVVPPVPVESIAVSPHTMTLYAGESCLEPSVSLQPYNATVSSYSHNTPERNILTMSGSRMTGIGPGTVQLAYKSADGFFTDECTVRVLAPGQAIEPVPLKLVASCDPSAGTAKVSVVTTADFSASALLWQLYVDTDIFTPDGVDANWSYCNGSSYGSSSIYAILKLRGSTIPSGATLATHKLKMNGTLNSACLLELHVNGATSTSGAPLAWEGGHANGVMLPSGATLTRATGVSLNKTALSIDAGGSEALTATVLPAAATDKRVSWTSSDTSVATVDESGRVEGKAAGTATVTAKTDSFSASCTVTVNAPKYTVRYDANGGSRSPASQIKTGGEAITLADTIPARDGYYFLGWSEDRDAVLPAYEAAGSYENDKSTTLYAVWREKGGSPISISRQATDLIEVTAIASGGERLMIAEYNEQGKMLRIVQPEIHLGEHCYRHEISLNAARVAVFFADEQGIPLCGAEAYER